MNRAPRIGWELRGRQIALGLCVGMSCQQIAEVLELPKTSIWRFRKKLFQHAGVRDAVEFVRRYNPAIRDCDWRRFLSEDNAWVEGEDAA